MPHYESQAHVRWACKYHIVFIPKFRRKKLYGQLRREVGIILRELCEQHGVQLLEGHAMPDHIHLLLAIPPKFAVSSVIGFLKGKSAIRIHHRSTSHRNVKGARFWARGYFVSTVGLNEQLVRNYIKNQERNQKRQMNFDMDD